MSRSRQIQGRVRAVGRGGDAVVDTSEGVVLMPGGLPGENVEFERMRSKRGAARGKLTRVAEGARGRRESPCDEAHRCGGCPLIIADMALQRGIKEGFLREACEGLPGASNTELVWIASPHELGYRRRARLAWHGQTLGYRQRHSSRVIDIGRCIVLAEPLQRAWDAAREHLRESIGGEGEIQLLLSDEAVVVELRTDDEQEPQLFEACQRLLETEGIGGVSLRTGDTEIPAVWGEARVATHAVDQALLWGPAGSFSQANDGINEMLVEHVAALAEPAGMRVLELHCGIGNFTVALAKAAKTLLAVEQDPGAAEACRANLAARRLDARVVEGDASRPPKGRYDVVVLDPPRQGAKALFENDAVWHGTRRIVYVSCDTATLSRDLRLACARGYCIDRMMAFDMFPQTAHLESLIRLVPH